MLLSLFSLLACEPEIIDTDHDGVEDAVELEMGTDPYDRDSDKDGFDDGVEFDAGTDGTSCWSVPEGWAECSSLGEQAVGQGWELGQVLPNFSMVDQDGQAMLYRRFYSMVTVLDLSAGWCGQCSDRVPELSSLQQDFADQGFTVLEIMVEGNTQSENADTAFCAEWSQDLDFPVTWDDSFDNNGVGINQVYARLSLAEHDVAFPYYVVLDREQRMVFTTNQVEELRAEIEPLL